MIKQKFFMNFKFYFFWRERLVMSVVFSSEFVDQNIKADKVPDLYKQLKEGSSATHENPIPGNYMITLHKVCY